MISEVRTMPVIGYFCEFIVRITNENLYIIEGEKMYNLRSTVITFYGFFISIFDRMLV